MNILEKIQKLPVIGRKIMLWTLMIIVSIFLVWLWSKSFNKSLQGVKKEGLLDEFKISDFKEKLEKDLPKVEIPSNLRNFNQ
ncbi:MAG: hypothetical protein NTU58_03235 [Candidatus Nealsonbacteria bacterium]|nr:hypothetical protein [Candidatus Nealsonbacteria bacterium]